MSSADTSAESPPADAAPSTRRRDGIRQLIDALLTLAFAVILVRTFGVEGYMISTGSMAPTLPGFHKRVTCPACRYEFAVGISDGDDPPGSLVGDGADPNPTAAERPAVCPNCGKHSIAVSALPRNQGDQLLVFKNAFGFRKPRRWEVVVFRNPSKPTQAYVKRAVGLPGETVSVKGGDVWINGRRARKNLAQQRAVRILVYDHNFEPRNDPSWKPRWLPDEETGWKRDGHGFAIGRDNASSRSKTSWVTYRHWIRGYGLHETTIDVPSDLTLDFANPSLFPVKFDAETRRLRHQGVLSDDARDRIARVYADRRFRRLIHQLAERSHLAPVNDEYGYNRNRNGHQPVPVRDVMLACDVTFRGGIGKFFVELTDGASRYRLTIDVGTRDVLLYSDDGRQPLRRAKLKADVLAETLHVEMSLFDRQVLAAVNGHALFKPLAAPELPQGVSATRTPARFGATGLSARVDGLRTFRDIYYTQKGRGKEMRLSDEQYFVLGDNSPISADSRVWPEAAVDSRL
ncbi:MAG: signal peptidase I, partial [Planctomycetaceae bacterium]